MYITFASFTRLHSLLAEIMCLTFRGASHKEFGLFCKLIENDNFVTSFLLQNANWVLQCHINVRN